MNTETIFIISIVIFGFVVLGYIVRRWLDEVKKEQQPSDEILEWLKNTGHRIDEQNKNITSTLQSSTKSLNERLDKAARYIGAVQKNIGEMSEIGRGMQELQEYLQSPKLRGNIGEQILKELLLQMLPKQSFNLQYSFKSGVTVDAAIKTASGIIPVDSKFPMENFRKFISEKKKKEKDSFRREFEKDVKKHIDSISKKYILTEEGTIDYALMYLPSESVYYEVVNTPKLFEYSSEKRVLPVSPTTFYAYLRAILMSFEGQKLSKQAQQIISMLRGMQKDYEKIDSNLSVLNKHITNAHNQLSNVLSSFQILGHKLTSASSLEIEETDNKKLKSS